MKESKMKPDTESQIGPERIDLHYFNESSNLKDKVEENF